MRNLKRGTPAHDIEFTVAPDGTLTYTVLGIPGGGCTDVAKVVDSAIGLNVESSVQTREAYSDHCADGAKQKQ